MIVNQSYFVLTSLIHYEHTVPFIQERATVSRTTPLKRMFSNNRQVEEEVKKAAITSFYGEKLYRTREANGILLFVSVLEHRVWILGDS